MLIITSNIILITIPVYTGLMFAWIVYARLYICLRLRFCPLFFCPPSCVTRWSFVVSVVRPNCVYSQQNRLEKYNKRTAAHQHRMLCKHRHRHHHHHHLLLRLLPNGHNVSAPHATHVLHTFMIIQYYYYYNKILHKSQLNMLFSFSVLYSAPLLLCVLHGPFVKGGSGCCLLAHLLLLQEQERERDTRAHPPLIPAIKL